MSLPVVPPETDTEITGPIPVIEAENSPSTTADTDQEEQAVDERPGGVRPQAPLDIRLLDGVREILTARPRWSQRPPSTAEAFEYSTTGDWTTEEKSAKRVFHGLCVLIAFILTYPIDWAVQAVRQKPIGFVLAIALLIVLGKVL